MVVPTADAKTGDASADAINAAKYGDDDGDDDDDDDNKR
jgi:hypothetical protein